jgi:cellulose synthase operon protein C
VFNDWVERSLDKLAELMPGRYAKFDLSSGFLASLETYTYRPPGVAPEPDPAEETDDEQAAPPEAETPEQPVDETVPDELTGEAVAAL